MAYRGATVPAPGIWPEDRPALVPARAAVAEAAVLVFFFIFYANLATVLTRFHGVPQIIASGVALLLLIPLARHMVLERQPLVVTPVLILVFAFLGALFLSAALSKDPSVSRTSVVGYLTEGLLLYLLVSNAVRTTRALRQVVWVLILAGSFMGILSIYQEVTHTYANDYAGLAQIDRLDTGGGFNVASADAPERSCGPGSADPLGARTATPRSLRPYFHSRCSRRSEGVRSRTASPRRAARSSSPAASASPSLEGPRSLWSQPSWPWWSFGSYGYATSSHCSRFPPRSSFSSSPTTSLA